MYELADDRFEQALAAAAGRGVRVRVLLDFGHRSDEQAARYLTAHGVSVRYGPRDVTVHQKTLTADGDASEVMTLNLESEDYDSTRDFALLDCARGDVAAIEATFTADWDGHTAGYKPGAGTGDLVWSPDARPALLRVIDGARRTLDVYAQEMDDDDVTDALCHAARSGVRVAVVMTFADQWRDALARLRGCGAAITALRADATPYVHAKAIIADGRLALVGSQNLSRASLDYSRELSLLVSRRAVVTRLESEFARDRHD
jgi:phosphatidylserine/phosphatidylglycerophosphate/cardiolipin synthase-like enzyme